MDFMTALDIGGSALSTDRTNLNVIAMNIANAKTTRTVDGGPYQRKTIVQEAVDIDNHFGVHMESALDRELKGVRVAGITNDNRPLKAVYEPGHPDADKFGYVMYPDINVVEEMANMMTAQRGYDASVTTIDTVKSMYLKALEIGKG